MSYFRELGYTVRKLVGGDREKEKALCSALCCSQLVLDRLYAGRVMPPWGHLEKIADVLGVSVQSLIYLDPTDYDKNAVHYYGAALDVDSREKILDIIMDYIDVSEAVAGAKLDAVGG